MPGSGTIKTTAAAVCITLLAACGDMLSPSSAKELGSFEVQADLLIAEAKLAEVARKHGAKVRRDPGRDEDPFPRNYLATVAEGNCLLRVEGSYPGSKPRVSVTLEAKDGSECTPTMTAMFDQLEKDLRDDCHVPIDGQQLFVGNPECLAKLPQRRMSGVWVHGFEHSIFYEGASRVPAEAFDEKRESWKTDLWMEAHPHDLLERQGFKYDGATRAFRIDFIGAKSESPGMYGHGGMYKRGALVTRILKLREIPLNRRN